LSRLRAWVTHIKSVMLDTYGPEEDYYCLRNLVIHPLYVNLIGQSIIESCIQTVSWVAPNHRLAFMTHSWEDVELAKKAGLEVVGKTTFDADGVFVTTWLMLCNVGLHRVQKERLSAKKALEEDINHVLSVLKGEINSVVQPDENPNCYLDEHKLPSAELGLWMERFSASSCREIRELVDEISTWVDNLSSAGTDIEPIHATRRGSNQHSNDRSIWTDQEEYAFRSNTLNSFLERRILAAYLAMVSELLGQRRIADKLQCLRSNPVIEVGTRVRAPWKTKRGVYTATVTTFNAKTVSLEFDKNAPGERWDKCPRRLLSPLDSTVLDDIDCLREALNKAQEFYVSCSHLESWTELRSIRLQTQMKTTPYLTRTGALTQRELYMITVPEEVVPPAE